MKVYIAGKLHDKEEIEILMKIDHLCKKLGLKTFLPHRDVGVAGGIEDVERIFRGDIVEGFKDCKLVVANLNGLHVGAGTAWELGYAYSKGIPTIGIKMDEPISEAFDYLSAILLGSMKIVSSFDELEKEIKKII